MAIPGESTGRYQGEFTEDGMHLDEPVPEIVTVCRSNDPPDERRLVGPETKARFRGDTLTLSPPSLQNASCRVATFIVGKAILMLARPGDMVHLTYTSTAEFGLSVLRGDSLVLAMGAVTAVPLGPEIKVRHGKESLRIDLTSQGSTENIGKGESTIASGYHIYVEEIACWDYEPGSYGCVAMNLDAGPKTNLAAVRGAVLLQARLQSFLSATGT